MSNYHLEIYEEPDSLSESELHRGVSELPPERRERALRFINMIDRKLSYLAYRLLRRGLAKHYNIPEEESLRIGYLEGGKPTLLDHPHIHFNISHCHEAVACILSDRPIGVDVEGLIDLDSELLQRVANPEEYRAVAEADDPALAFTTLWTRKESYLKMTGVGLVDDLHSVLDSDVERSVHFESHYAEGHNYVLSLCHL